MAMSKLHFESIRMHFSYYPVYAIGHLDAGVRLSEFPF